MPRYSTPTTSLPSSQATYGRVVSASHGKPQITSNVYEGGRATTNPPSVSESEYNCLVPHCGFGTTTQGSLTRHYRERHYMEPPATQYTASTPRRFSPKKTHDAQQRQKSAVASTSRLSDSYNARFRNESPHLSGAVSPVSSIFASGSAQVSPPATGQHYPATAYYSASSSASPAASPPPVNIAAFTNSMRARLNAAIANQQANQAAEASRQLAALQNSSICAGYVGWRDDVDVANDVLDVATGHRRIYPGEELTEMMEFLPPTEDIGMADKNQLFAW
ncbi:hypothetical protein R3P38DRAFT_2860453 [Favolaschia claudopus]|uniref:C2H2-type domain-containing protein n=1 Tax=Favolaschia claudopus TaxID=2862362 RepID=A0AAW0DN94_9AGAR